MTQSEEARMRATFRSRRSHSHSGIVALALLGLVGMALSVAGCGSDATRAAGSTDASANDTQIVVTTPLLGAVVSDLVGDRAEVTVIMPIGADPHEFKPSAKDRATLERADLIVANGLGLEHSLEDAIDEAGAQGTPVFVAGDNIDVRTFGPDEIQEDEHAEDGAAEDPHFWVDPLAMKQVVAALTLELAAEAGLDLGPRAVDVEAELDELNSEVVQILTPIPAERRVLVTGHESMGYFARQYGFTLVGAVIPSTTSQAAASAGELADLKAEIERYRVPAIFSELGTSPAVVEAIADETGVRVVELLTHTVPADGSYATFILDLAHGVADGLDAS